MAFEMGEYRAIELIGSGSSAQVWRGQVMATGRPVAMKVFPPEALAAARREAALAAAVDHSHVPAVLDVLADHDRAVLVTELAVGGSLEQLLERRPKLSPGEVLTIMVPLAGVLAKAHERALVHGDLSTANVLFDGAGRPLLADLGAARAAAEPGLPVLVTPADTAPEIAHGDPPTSASDMFSLGSVALACLTGRHAWPADDLRDVAIQSTAGQWPDPGDVAGPPGLIDAIRALLRREPARRPSAAALLVTLRATGPAAPVALHRPTRHGIKEPTPEQRVREPPEPAGTKTTTAAAATPAAAAGTPATRATSRSDHTELRPSVPAEEAQRALRAKAVTRARADAVQSLAPPAGPATKGRRRLVDRARRRLAGASGPAESNRRARADRRSNASATSAAPPRAGPARVAVLALAGVLLCGGAAAAGLWWARHDRAGPTPLARLTPLVAPTADIGQVVSAATAISTAGSISNLGPLTAAGRDPTAGPISTARLMSTAGPISTAGLISTTGPSSTAGPLPAAARIPDSATSATAPVSITPVSITPERSTRSPGIGAATAMAATSVTAPRTSQAAVDWLSVMTVLDRNRALALIYRDSALLDAVYAPSSRGRAADTGLINRMRAGGLRVTGADHTLLSASLLPRGAGPGGPAGIRIDVADRLPSYSVLDETGATVSRTRPRGISHRVVELVSRGSGYLIVDVLAAAPANGRT